MPEIKRHEPGSFCWTELATTDPAAAKTFYTSLFDWIAEDTPAGPDMIYTMLRLRGLEVGALYKQDKQEADQGVPSHWNLYVATESADQTAARAKELGGKVLMEAFDVMEHGRMAVLQDPTGAVMSVWQPKEHVGARLVNEPGAFCWAELYTKDTKKAGEFYAKLFGWTLKESPGYTEFHRGTQAVGGMMAIQADWGPMPPNWMPYFQVTDTAWTAERVRKLGGQVHKGPENIPEVGPFAILGDPTGAGFAIIRLDRR